VNRIRKETNTVGPLGRAPLKFENNCNEGPNTIGFLSYPIHKKTEIERVSETQWCYKTGNMNSVQKIVLNIS
jgi:hypothetical protein